MSPQGTIYLLHFDRPFGHAQHYTGWASNLDGRLKHHANGSGATLLRHVRNAGIGWTLARTWSGDRNRERALKKQGGASRHCPICKGGSPCVRDSNADYSTNEHHASTT